MGRTIRELAMTDAAEIEAVDLMGLETHEQSIEDGRAELNRAIAGWNRGD